MKTYKHIFEELLKEENITQCFHDAAKRKTTRPEVANDRPDPQCLQEHVKALQKILEEETFKPPEHRKQLINEYSCGKVREIIKPEYQYEQVVHHCIIKQLQPIILHGLYEHALGSIPKRGCHSGKKRVEKWIKGYKGKKFYILKADVRHCFDTEDQRACVGLHGICISLQSHNASQINPEACNKEGAQNRKERESQLV